MSERIEELLAKMILLQERENELLTEMSGKLDDIMRGVALSSLGHHNFVKIRLTDDARDFLERKGNLRFSKKESYY